MKNLVLLHGWGFNSSVWDNLKLSQDFNLIKIDLPDYNNLKEIIVFILDLAPEKATYLGWSLGGLIAMGIAVYFPERVEHCITIASSPKFIETQNWQGVSEKWFDVFETSVRKNPKRALKSFILNLLPETQCHLYPQIEKYLADLDTKHLLSGLNVLESVDLREELLHSAVRQAHLRMADDVLVPENIEFKQIQIPNTYHFSVITEPELILKYVKKYSSI